MGSGVGSNAERHWQQGERVAVAERMIVAPAVGVFRPLLDHAHDDAHTSGVEVDAGQAIGLVEGPGTAVEIRSPFRGLLVRIVALPGERLREGQPIAWMRVS